MLFNKTIQYTNLSDINDSLTKMTKIKISNLLICFCGFDLSCPILENDNFIKNVFIVLSQLTKISFLLKPCLF